MKRILLFLFITVLMASASSFAQIVAGNPAMNRFSAAAAKDTAYKRFKAQVAAIAKTAKGRDTKIAEIRKLFNQHATMLQAIYKKYNLPETGEIVVKQSTSNNKYKISQYLPAHYKPIGGGNQTNYPYQLYPPYTDKWKTFHVPNTPYPATEIVTASSGKIEWTVFPALGTAEYYKNMGLFHTGFVKKISVPANPLILAARVKFDYSFFYTGWDTRSAETAIDLAVQASTNFISPSFDALPQGPYLQYVPPVNRWKSAALFLQQDSVTTDLVELHGAADSSFTLEGYVTPGSELQFRVGYGYLDDSWKGINGCYHYGEFILKKITVTWLTSGE